MAAAAPGTSLTRLAARATAPPQPRPCPRCSNARGDFSQSIGAQGPVTIYDPLTGNPFPGNVIPVNRINSASLGLLQYYPLPNAPGYKQNYQAPITTSQNSDNINTRVNQTINTKNRLNGG